jgi:hypothetical protein
MALAKEMVGPFTAGQADAIGGQYSTIAATGSIQGDAALVNSGMVIVTGADGTKGIILPATQLGDDVTIFNNSALTLKVWPNVGAAIAVPGTGVGSANASFAHLTYKSVRYMTFGSTQWVPITSA